MAHLVCIAAKISEHKVEDRGHSWPYIVQNPSNKHATLLREHILLASACTCFGVRFLSTTLHQVCHEVVANLHALTSGSAPPHSLAR
eukprot:5683097-Amphidinium_carterae.1